jgi:hypothetical protein
MSQTQYIQLLKSQLRMLNRIIDEKIMQGKSYSTEARRHKMILQKIENHSKQGFFDKMYSFFNYA